MDEASAVALLAPSVQRYLDAPHEAQPTAPTEPG
jgi:hypothetical protein